MRGIGDELGPHEAREIDAVMGAARALRDRARARSTVYTSVGRAEPLPLSTNEAPSGENSPPPKTSNGRPGRG